MRGLRGVVLSMQYIICIMQLKVIWFYKMTKKFPQGTSSVQRRITFLEADWNNFVQIPVNFDTKTFEKKLKNFLFQHDDDLKYINRRIKS